MLQSNTWLWASRRREGSVQVQTAMEGDYRGTDACIDSGGADGVVDGDGDGYGYGEDATQHCPEQVRISDTQRERTGKFKPYQKKESKEWWYVQYGERCKKDSVGVVC